mmetsp:Transcript_26392/g.71360  ORF Transcript_26392/g.71360 Transcript_26392/m.71360 type:complete len:84 (-) Transcript_26392:1090-1341(-)|eukprot:1150609-Pelagomonas_calceolata.AAC.2
MGESRCTLTEQQSVCKARGEPKQGHKGKTAANVAANVAAGSGISLPQYVVYVQSTLGSCVCRRGSKLASFRESLLRPQAKVIG